MSNNIFKTQFSGGELAPSMYARVDSNVYPSGAKTLYNMYLKPHGSAANRGGTEFVGQARSSGESVPDSRNVRLLPFQFNTTDAYVLEFGHKYMRVIREGGYVFKDVHEGTVQNVSSITKANPCVVSMSGLNEFRTGDVVRLATVSGMTEVTNKTFIVSAWTGSSITLADLDGTPIDSTGYSTYTGGGTVTGQALAIVNITRATTARLTTYSNHNLQNGDWIQIAGVAGMDQINGRTVVVQNHTANECDLYDLDGNPLDTTNFSAYTVPASGAYNGRCREIFVKSMPYEGADLNNIRFSQSADVMALTHPNYTPRLLTRQGHAIWRLDEISFEPPLEKPENITATPTHTHTLAITGITKEANAKITLATGGGALWTTGCVARVSGVGGMTQINGDVIMLGAATGVANQYYITDTKYTPINTSSYDSYTSGGTLNGSTLYRYSVSAVTSDGKEGRATSAPVVISRAMSSPFDAGAAPPKITLQWDGVANASFYNIYRQREVTDGQPSQGSLYGFVGTSSTTQFVDQNVTPDFTRTPPKFKNPFRVPEKTAKITAITNALPMRISFDSTHGFVKGDRLKITGVGRMTEAEGLVGKVDRFSDAALHWVQLVSLDDGTDIDSTSWQSFKANISGITKATEAVITTSFNHNLSTGDPIFIDGISGMIEMNGMTGTAVVVSPTELKLRLDSTEKIVDSSSFTAYITSGFVASNEAIAARVTPQNNPTATAYYQQRRIYGGSLENPQTLWMSQTGDFNNMDQSDPIRDSDSITYTLSALQINEIKHIVPIASLLILTGGGCFKVSGGSQGGGITPTSIQITPQTYSGASDVPPLVLNADILYVSGGSRSVLGLSYNFYQDSYSTVDLSIRSKHLLDGYSIVSWGYAPDPDNLIYMVRNDGKLLMLTYLKEVEVVAWSQGGSEGEHGADAFESVAVVREGEETVAYFVVRRWICNANGCMFRQYVERMRTRNLIKDGKPDPMRGYFVDCGVYYDGEPIRIIKNLEHLEGRTVQVVADGNVLAPRPVVDGKVDLGIYATVVMVGLGYTSKIETLPIDLGNGAISGKRKRISAVTLRMINSRGVKAGQAKTGLVAAREIRQGQVDNTIIPLVTGDMRYNLYSNMDTDGSIIIQQDYPLPMEIAGVSYEITVGDS